MKAKAEDPEGPRPRARGRGRWVIRGAALCFLLQLAFGVFGPPAALVSWLRCDGVDRVEEPEWIVILGGSGLPSTSTLLRTYYGAQCALAHPRARCVVALPAHGEPGESAVGRMRDELILRGVDRRRIVMETEGRNTHEQAVNVARLLGPAGRRRRVILVSSPYHLRRAWLCFRHEGFEQLGVLPAHSTGSEAAYRRAAEAWSGMPGMRGFAARMRYGFWSNLIAEVWIMRECLGLGVYKLSGWL